MFNSKESERLTELNCQADTVKYWAITTLIDITQSHKEMRGVSLYTDTNSKPCVLAPAIADGEKGELLHSYAAQFNCSIDPPPVSILYQDADKFYAKLGAQFCARTADNRSVFGRKEPDVMDVNINSPYLSFSTSIDGQACALESSAEFALFSCGSLPGANISYELSPKTGSGLISLACFSNTLQTYKNFWPNSFWALFIIATPANYERQHGLVQT